MSFWSELLEGLAAGASGQAARKAGPAPRPVRAPVAPPAPPRPAPAAAPASPVAKPKVADLPLGGDNVAAELFGTRDAARRAVIAAEVLGPPLAYNLNRAGRVLEE